MKLPSGECHKTSLMIGQHCFWWWHQLTDPMLTQIYVTILSDYCITRSQWVKEAWGVPQWICPLNLRLIQWALCVQMHGNCSTNCCPANDGNSAKYDQKLVTPGYNPMMSSPIKFELNLICVFSIPVNVQKLQTCDRRTDGLTNGQAICMVPSNSVVMGQLKIIP